MYYNFVISNYDNVSSLQLPNGLGRGEGQVMRPLKHDLPLCILLNTRPLNLEDSGTHVSEETAQLTSACRYLTRHKKLLECDEPCPKPDNAGPIVRFPMGLPVMVSCDTAWDRTRVCIYFIFYFTFI